METQTDDLSYFTVKSGKIHIGDPCYGIGAWCGNYNIPAKNGAWVGKVTYSDEKSWGTRVAILEAHNVDYLVEETGGAQFSPSEYRYKTLLNEIGVDSGKAGVFCSSIYDDSKPNGVDTNNPRHFYDYCCRATGSPEQAGTVMGGGFVSCTGLGDGSYSGYGIFNDAGEAVGIRIVFLDDDDDDDESDSDEED